MLHKAGHSKIESGWCSAHVKSGPSRNIEPFEANKKDKEKNKRSKELKNTTVQSSLERAGGSVN